MKTQQHMPVQSPEQIRSRAADRLRRLIDRPIDGDRSLDDLLEILLLLNSLPLTTSEFAVATSRLNNARRYLVAGEHGAARYELRLLLGSLKEPQEGGPSRRRLGNRQL